MSFTVLPVSFSESSRHVLHGKLQIGCCRDGYFLRTGKRDTQCEHQIEECN